MKINSVEKKFMGSLPCSLFGGLNHRDGKKTKKQRKKPDHLVTNTKWQEEKLGAKSS